MNDKILDKRIKADGMKLDYRSELAIASGEKVVYKSLLAYADIINDFMLDGRTFNYTPEQVIIYTSTMSGCMMRQMNKIRGVSDEEFINHMLDEMAKEIPDHIREQLDQIADEPWLDDDPWQLDDTDYDEEDDEDEK